MFSMGSSDPLPMGTAPMPMDPGEERALATEEVEKNMVEIPWSTFLQQEEIPVLGGDPPEFWMDFGDIPDVALCDHCRQSKRKKGSTEPKEAYVWHKRSCIFCFVNQWLTHVWEQDKLDAQGRPWDNLLWHRQWESDALRLLNTKFRELPFKTWMHLDGMPMPHTDKWGEW